LNRPFIKGLELSRLFYHEAVKPILANHFPDLIYSAALIGSGSDVLGFDTPQSMDHDWGPRLMLFLHEDDHESYHEEIHQRLNQELPGEVFGYPTRFARHEDGSAVMAENSSASVQHGVRLLTVQGYFKDILKFDPVGRMRAVDWISIPQYSLLMLTSGSVFEDGLGQLAPIRAKLNYFPHEIWLYLLAAQWQRIAQEEAFMGRCGQIGDDLGSRLVAARLVHDLMRLCFLMEKQYAPYIKWLGSAFAQLNCASNLAPLLTKVMESDSWQERQTYLTSAYEFVAEMHNALEITPLLPAKVTPFHQRPFSVLHADRFCAAIREVIKSEEVLALPEHLGAIDQFVDSTDGLIHLHHFTAIYTNRGV
jgi:hypothetical protein